MSRVSKPPAEHAIDEPLVRALLREQHPDLADLSLTENGEGWDNRVFRLGDELAVRVPRRQASAVLIEHEQQWLPDLATRLPLPTPTPVRIGRPGCGFPWLWSVVRWLEGEPATVARPFDVMAAAVDLGRFLDALHRPAPPDAPRNPWRGVPLTTRSSMVEEHVQRLTTLVDASRVLDAWTRALRAPPWAGPPLWIHGDLHPGNLLVSGGRLSAVIDFGDVTSGDPATDLSVAWLWLPPAARPIFRASARQGRTPIDDDTWARARGWALALGLSYLVRSEGDAALAAIARHAIEAVLAD